MLPTVVEQQSAGRRGEGSSLASLPSATGGEGEEGGGESIYRPAPAPLACLLPHSLSPQSPRVCLIRK